MARRVQPSSSRSMASRGMEEVTGKETGLPLIVCPTCERERIIELRVKTEENDNMGRMFFKCPRNVPGMPGRCRFYEFQREYLKKLVELKYVIIDLEAGLVEEAAEVQSLCAPNAGNKSMELKMDALISQMKRLTVLLMK